MMLGLITAAVQVTTVTATVPALKGQLQYEGYYVEGCSCSAPCPCELTGVAMGCEGVGGFYFRRGTFEGQDISGTRMAYAVAPGSWVICYVDAPTEAKRAAVASLARTAFAAWGKMEAVKATSIQVSAANGNLSMKINGGAICTLTAKPFLGMDKKNPIKISNINSVLHPEVWQATVETCTFNDGGHQFEIKGSNAYYNPTIKVSGSLSAAE
ncbi:DUF1326 domain-containing protein [Fimbriimonadia bacterium ATM]|nr:MAG: DUF1326 domain-containing protein [Armatimonadota bacterium]MBC6968967.1 DUF1326 domain-containing protein [Armatimonadota bacterium]MCE7900096.1 DUF1326 domain-containing protein [Armatimonadetes bacterium ATM1]MDL1929399.1 DUF1326 domain-containing protein [Fimbriimonadia bacterium ATM]RIJ95130.1 MAG: hypothetical protein DCC45_11040 [Armatimonadota bacterium]